MSFQERRDLILADQQREAFGIYTPEILQKMWDAFNEERLFSVTEARALPPVAPLSIAKHALHPRAFAEWKTPHLPAMTGAAKQAEAPLFEQAQLLRSVILPLQAALLCLQDETIRDDALSRFVLQSLLDETKRQFKEVNYRRFVAIQPEERLKRVLKLPPGCALLNEDTMDVQKEARRVADIIMPRDGDGDRKKAARPTKSLQRRNKGPRQSSGAASSYRPSDSSDPNHAPATTQASDSEPESDGSTEFRQVSRRASRGASSRGGGRGTHRRN